MSRVTQIYGILEEKTKRNTAKYKIKHNLHQPRRIACYKKNKNIRAEIRFVMQMSG
jgi:hypothetical protein